MWWVRARVFGILVRNINIYLPFNVVDPRRIIQACLPTIARFVAFQHPLTSVRGFIVMTLLCGVW